MAAVTAVVIAAIGVSMAAVSASEQSRAQKASAEYNAMVAKKNAEAAKKQAAEEERRFRIQARKEAAANRARLGKAGLQPTGSALELLQSNARQAEEDAQQIRMYGNYNQQGFLRDARFARAAGGAAARATQMRASGQIASGASRTASMA